MKDAAPQTLASEYARGGALQCPLVATSDGIAHPHLVLFFFLFEFRLFRCQCLYIWLRLCFFVRFRLFLLSFYLVNFGFVSLWFCL